MGGVENGIQQNMLGWEGHGDKEKQVEVVVIGIAWRQLDQNECKMMQGRNHLNDLFDEH